MSRSAHAIAGGLILVVVLCSGCVTSKLNERLGAGTAEQEEEFNALLDREASAPLKRISWAEAEKRMYRDNLALMQSRKMLEDAERQTKRQWLSLVPRMSAFLNLSKGIGSITDFSTDDVNAYVVASFNIPNPFEFYASLYAAALQKQNAVWSQEVDNRRAFTELYSAFMEAEAVRDEEVAMRRRWKSLSGLDPGNIAKGLKNMESEARMMERRRELLRGNINQLLNTPGANWELSGRPPAVSYRDRYRRIRVGEDFGKLALNLYAVQIEGAILQTQRVKFRQWPAINFGLSNPPLYSSTQDYQYTSDDYRLFSGVAKSVDLTDIGGRESIQDAEYRLKVTRGQLRQRMAREAARLLQIRSSYEDLLGEEVRLQRELKRLERPDASIPEIVLADIGLRSELELQLIQTRRRIQQLDLQLLIWDERYWKS